MSFGVLIYSKHVIRIYWLYFMYVKLLLFEASLFPPCASPLCASVCLSVPHFAEYAKSFVTPPSPHRPDDLGPVDLIRYRI